MTNKSPLPVTQEDREAANALFGGTPWSTEQFLSGKRDRTDKVQAFTAHRLRAVADADQMREAERRAVARCIEIVRETSEGFLSPEFATGQPMSSFSERFACGQCAEAIENEFAIGTTEQCRLLGKPTPGEQYRAALTGSAKP